MQHAKFPCTVVAIENCEFVDESAEDVQRVEFVTLVHFERYTF
jgi:hypothetical protein